MDVLSDVTLCAYIINGFGECVWIKEIDKPGFLFISEQSEHTWGYPASAFLADATLLPALIHPEDRESVSKYADYSGTSQSVTYTYRIISSEGETKYIEESVHAYMQESTLLLLGKSKPLPAERLTLLAEHDKFKALLNSGPDINLYIDTRGKILGFNRMAAGLAKRFGQLTLAEGDAFLDYAQLFSPGQVTEAAHSLREATAGNIVKKEVLLDYPLHPGIWLSVRYIPMRNEQEQIIGISFSATDITREKNTEMHLVQQNTALRNIAWLHAHQLRHPVANIIGLAEILQGMTRESPDMCKALELLRASAELLDQNIKKIVHLSEEYEALDKQADTNNEKTPSTFVESEVISE